MFEHGIPDSETIETLLVSTQLSPAEITILFQKYLMMPHPRLNSLSPYEAALERAEHLHATRTAGHPEVDPDAAVCSVIHQLERSLQGLANKPVGDVRKFLFGSIRKNIYQQYHKAKLREARQQRLLEAKPTPRADHQQQLQDLVRLLLENRRDLADERDTSEMQSLINEYNKLEQTLIVAIAEYLTPAVRPVYELAFGEHLEPAQIARKLKLNGNTSRQYLMRAIEQAKLAITENHLNILHATQMPT